MIISRNWEKAEFEKAFVLEGNTVMVSLSGKTVDGETINTNTTIKYSSVEIKGLDNGKEPITFVIGWKDNQIDIYNAERCQLISSARDVKKLEFAQVIDETFVILDNGEMRFVYDEVGNLIDSDLSERKAMPTFKGAEVCIRKEYESKKRYFTIEGYLIG